MASSERVDLASAGPPWREEHLARYFAAEKWLPEEGLILDVASGTGEGAAFLMAPNRTILGVDIDEAACARSRAAVEEVPGRGFAIRGSADDLPLPDGSAHGATTFETIEHVPDAEAFLGELTRVVRPGGVMCLSTPNALVTNPAGGPPSNPFHLMEFTPAALRALISEEWQVLLHAGQHLPARYGVAPFLPSFDRGGLSAGQRVNFRYWQVMLRASWIRDLVHRAISGIPFYPQRHDYTFVADDLERAHVQYLVARRG